MHESTATGRTDGRTDGTTATIPTCTEHRKESEGEPPRARPAINAQPARCTLMAGPRREPASHGCLFYRGLRGI